MKRKKRRQKKVMKLTPFFSIISFFFLVVILAIAVSFLQYRQIVRQNAAGPTTYGTCNGGLASSPQGVCYAQPNTCTSQGLTQYSSSVISNMTICGVNAKTAGVAVGTTMSCCPNNSGYTNNYGACGTGNQGTCTTNPCIGGAAF